MAEHTHDHHEEFAEDGAQAGNVEIHAGDTAQSAYSELYTELPVWTLAQMVDDLDNFPSWSMDEVTFSFPTEESTDYENNSRTGTLAVLSNAQAAAARDVFALFGDLIDFTFVDAGDDVDADIRFYNSTLSGTAGGSPAGPGIAGDAWFYNYDPATIDNRNLDPGSYQYHLLVHELGHVMGLTHTSFSSGDSYVERANYLQNNAAYSMMSYLTAGSGGLAWDTTYSSTPMLADVAALQSIYGANMTTRTGDTVYGFNATANRQVFDFDGLLETYGQIGAITIWDAGGHDTLDMSKFSDDGFINLAQASHSSVGGYDLNVAIADGAVIEDAIAGTGNDILLGNEVANTLTGSLGADTLNGMAGNDRLIGDAKGAELRDFSHGTVFLGESQSVSVDIDATGMTAFTLEMLISFDEENTSTQWFGNMPGQAALVYDGGNHGIWFRSNGDWLATGIKIADFADGDLHRVSVSYDGLAGEVRFYLDGTYVKSATGDLAPPLGQMGTETISFNHDGGLADVRLFDGARSAEEIAQYALHSVDSGAEGLLANLVFDAEQGVDTVGGITVAVSEGATFGETVLVTFDDVLDGGAGDDVLFGGAGADTLEGGDGVDLANYRWSLEGVTVDLGLGSGVGGDAQGDVLSGIERVAGSFNDDLLIGSDEAETLNGLKGDDTIYGNAGADKLFGNVGDDYLDAGSGDDVIAGKEGNDTIIGAAGDDKMSSGEGADLFVFYAGDGADRISDFELDTDVLHFVDVAAFADLNINAHASGSLVTGGDVTVVLRGIDALMLDAAQFEFGAFDIA